MLEAAVYLRKYGHIVYIVVPWRGNLLARLTEDNIPFHIIPYLFWTHPKKLKPIFLLRMRHLIGHIVAAKKLWNLIRKIGPDVVVTNTITIPAGALAAKWAGVPHVWYIHEFGEEDHHIAFQYSKRFSLWFMDRFSNLLIVNSLAVKMKIQEYISPDKLRLVYYAVQVPTCSLPKQQDDGKLRLVLVGRIISSKGQEDAVRALFRLKNNGIEAHLSLVGNEDKEYGPFLRELIRELHLQGMVTFIPFTPNPFPYVLSSHLALVCSKNEAFGRVTVEAMKLGKPVVGANSGGTTELIRDGWNGFLYKTGNAEDLAEKIEILYRDKEKLSEFGRNAQRWASEQFSAEKYIRNLVNVFDEVVRRNEINLNVIQ